jgi:hypothetical protein
VHCALYSTMCTTASGVASSGGGVK